MTLWCRARNSRTPWNAATPTRDWLDRDICHPKTGGSTPFWQLGFHTPDLNECLHPREFKGALRTGANYAVSRWQGTRDFRPIGADFLVLRQGPPTRNGLRFRGLRSLCEHRLPFGQSTNGLGRGRFRLFARRDVLESHQNPALGM